jgi:hypothetical protein
VHGGLRGSLFDARRLVGTGDPDAGIARIRSPRLRLEGVGDVARNVDERVGRFDPDRADVGASDVPAPARHGK